MKTNKTVIQVAFILAFGTAAINAQAAMLNLGDRLAINPGQATYDANGYYTSVPGLASMRMVMARYPQIRVKWYL